MEWTQGILAVGEAFAGCPDAGLRPLLERQSAKFFRLYHHSNIEVGLYACVGVWAAGMGQMVAACLQLLHWRWRLVAPCFVVSLLPRSSADTASPATHCPHLRRRR